MRQLNFKNLTSASELVEYLDMTTKRPEEKDEKQVLIREIKEKVEDLLAADSITEAEKEKLLRRALKIIEDGKKKGVVAQ